MTILHAQLTCTDQCMSRILALLKDHVIFGEIVVPAAAFLAACQHVGAWSTSCKEHLGSVAISTKPILL